MSRLTYDSSQIQRLPALEGIRRRPAMYIGDIAAPGLHLLLFDVVASAASPFMMGRSDTAVITLHLDGSVTCVDNSHGEKLDVLAEREGVSLLETIFTQIHAGRLFNSFESRWRDEFRGVHGVAGPPTCNALSEWCRVRVDRGGESWRIDFSRGEVTEPLRRVESAGRHGMTVSFKPDPQIFETTDFDFDQIMERLREIAALYPGVKLSVDDERDGRSEMFHYPDGLADYLRPSLAGKARDEVAIAEIIYEDTEFAFAFSVHQEPTGRCHGFVNALRVDEGTHINGFWDGFVAGLGQFGRRERLLSSADNDPVAEHCRPFVTAAVSLWHPDPLFESPTRSRLGNVGVRLAMSSLVRERVRVWTAQQPGRAEMLLRLAMEPAAAESH
jgi:DNA gyrase subunit B